MKKRLAYKGFEIDENKNLYCRPAQVKEIFEIGKVKQICGELELCKNGIHFCWNINDVHTFYNLREKVICEVEILGNVINQPNMEKSCTNQLRIN